MIPRFNYSFSPGEAWDAANGLFRPECSNAAYYKTLFPSSTVYEVSSARAGLTYALQALQLKQQARIGVQPYTCSSVMSAIRAAGFSPVFIDINHQLTLNCDDLATKLHEIDALIVTHTFGVPADINRIKKLVGNLPVIEDCAHAFLSRYEGIQVGNFFDLAVFSFGNGKFPALGNGGLLVVNNTNYERHITKKIAKLKKNTLAAEMVFICRRLIYSFIYSGVGYQLLHSVLNKLVSNRGNVIFAEPEKAQEMYKTVRYLINRNAKKFQALAARQRQNAQAILDENKSNFDIVENEDPGSNCFAIVCLDARRDALYNHLIQNGIGAGKHFQYAKAWASTFGYQYGTCPQFEDLVEKVITIPCDYSLKPADLATINTALNQFTQKRGVSISPVYDV